MADARVFPHCLDYSGLSRPLSIPFHAGKHTGFRAELSINERRMIGGFFTAPPKHVFIIGNMRSTFNAAYRQDAQEFLEFCQDTHLRFPLSKEGLETWIAHLSAMGFPSSDISAKRASVETLFRHVGVLPDTDNDKAP